MLSTLKSIETKARRDNHRYLVVFSGDPHLVKSALIRSLPQLDAKDALIVTDDSDWCASLGLPGKALKGNQIKHYLGSDTECLVWDGFSGLNPDGLGAASGLIKGGGLLFLLLPEFETLRTTPDPDYLRMCSSQDELPLCGTRFLQRLVQLVEVDNAIRIFTQNALSELLQLPANSLCVPATTESKPCLPTEDQRATIQAIEAVAKGHRKRPLVIRADRGRGKSSALGMAAAKICCQDQFDVIITAPSQLSCAAAFQHFDAETKRLQSLTPQPEQPAALRFFSPDQLIATKPPCHLLMVDEAAAIPAPMLSELLMHYSRIVFSSTIHGYEGTGQGFAVRFRKTLDTCTPNWKSIQLHQPVRWAGHDPLERWIDNLLLLNTEIAVPPDPGNTELSALPVQWLEQSDLMAKDALLRQIIGLLVLAHYQTSPSDIRLILDHPAIHLGIIKMNDKVLAAVLLIREGGVDDPELTQAIINGERRPRGQLVPQLLTASTRMTSMMAKQTFRVMRIAVHPSLVNLGLGSKLIQASVQLARQNSIDYVSASFGFTSELLAFWSKNHFQLLRIGYHKDAASGTPSAIVALATASEIEEPLRQCRHIFRQHFVYGLSRYYRTLDWKIIDDALLSLEPEPMDSDPPDQVQLNAVARHKRSLEDSALALNSMILNHYSKGLIRRLSTAHRQLIIMKLLQGRSWQSCINTANTNGRKQTERMLREALAQMLELS